MAVQPCYSCNPPRGASTTACGLANGAPTRDLVNEAKQEEADWLYTQAGDRAPDIVQVFLRFRPAL